MSCGGPDGQWLPGARWVGRGAGQPGEAVVEDLCPCYVSVEGLSSSNAGV